MPHRKKSKYIKILRRSGGSSPVVQPCPIQIQKYTKVLFTNHHNSSKYSNCFVGTRHALFKPSVHHFGQARSEDPLLSITRLGAHLDTIKQYQKQHEVHRKFLGIESELLRIVCICFQWTRRIFNGYGWILNDTDIHMIDHDRI